MILWTIASAVVLLLVFLVTMAIFMFTGKMSMLLVWIEIAALGLAVTLLLIECQVWVIFKLFY